MKKKKKSIKILVVTIISIIVICIVIYFLGFLSVSKKNDNVKFIINSGESTIKIIENLKAANIIKSNISALIYTKINNFNLQAGEFTLNRADNAREIIKQIAAGKLNNSDDTITITFVEGKRITDYAKLISDKFGYNYEEILNIFKDESYAKELIGKYSFLTDKILDNDIYYPLEGYLFPDTYTFYKNSSPKEIIEKMLKQENIKLNSLKASINDKNISIHDLVTMASIVEMEGTNATNRANIAQVIYKRLDKNVNLGMDVTTYYATQKKLQETLTKNDINSTSKYNTRNENNIGLPVGPICSPSLESIMATLNPSDTNYEWFFASSDGNIYFTNDYNEFLVFKHNG